MNKGHAIQTNLTLGELLVIYIALDKISKGTIVSAYELESGASVDETNVDYLKKKIIENGAILEILNGGTMKTLNSEDNQ